MDSTPGLSEAFTIERRGDLTIITATPALERMSFGLEREAARLILQPVEDQGNPQIVIDLSRVGYFGSNFLALLIRCWKMTEAKGGTMVLAGVSERARELLHLTSLDIVWPIYATRAEAMEALLSD